MLTDRLVGSRSRRAPVTCGDRCSRRTHLAPSYGPCAAPGGTTGELSRTAARVALGAPTVGLRSSFAVAVWIVRIRTIPARPTAGPGADLGAVRGYGAGTLEPSDRARARGSATRNRGPPGGRRPRPARQQHDKCHREHTTPSPIGRKIQQPRPGSVNAAGPRTGLRPPNGHREGTNWGRRVALPDDHGGPGCARRAWKAIDEFRPPRRSLRHDVRDVAGAHHHRRAGRGCVRRPRRPQEPHGSYEMTQRVVVFDPSRAFSWKPGHDFAGDGKPRFGGWTWRNDLVATGPSHTEVTPTEDWTAVAPFLREHITFLRFPPATSRTRCATSRSWSNRPRLTAVRHPVAELIANRRPLGRRSTSSRAPEEGKELR